MADIHIYQIHYSVETMHALDPGFIPLDNQQNERPDWREYWPIRNFLLSNDLVPEDYYGFFSPKFRSKTNLDSSSVFEFIRNQSADTDVILFSPAFDQIAFYRNPIEQALINHSDGHDREFWRSCVEVIDPKFGLDTAITSSVNTVFGNYFVAKAKFWSTWLSRCEAIFALAEANDTPVGRLLNSGAGNETVPRKVFVIERVASVLMATSTDFQISAHNPMTTNLLLSPLAQHPIELMVLDALKTSFLRTGYEQYRQLFEQLRVNLPGGGLPNGGRES